jgi:tRNA nucleotidyltransferase/poly(A) polymerase
VADAPRQGAREAAAAVAARLESAGFTAYFAGGCVRDELMGHAPADYDVATAATPDQIRGVFPGARGVGEHFGVMLVRQGGRTIEVATFRGEGEYADGRRPGRVEFSDERTDARRRDFTINGLFMRPATGEVIDHVGGRADLAAGTLRAIGDADARLEEDRLRLLRAVRFAARFGMRMDAATADAVRRHAPELRGVSRERVGHEVRRMLSHATRGEAVDMIESLGLAPATLLEEGRLEGVRVRALRADASVHLAIAAWLLDRVVASPRPERLSRWTSALVLSNAEAEAVDAALRARESLRERWSGLAVAQRKRLAAGPGFADALDLLEAEGDPRAASVRADVAELSTSGLAPTPLLDGHALQALGLKPGPAFRRILDAVYDAQLEGRVDSPQGARELALRIAEQA